MFTLYTQDGKEMRFYVEECALIFQQVFGGTLRNNNPSILRFGGLSWQQDSYLQEQKLRQRMEERDLY